MSNFGENLINNRYQGKLLSFFLVFSLSINSLYPQVIDKLEQERETQAKNSYLSQENKLKTRNIFDGKNYLLYDSDTFFDLNSGFINPKEQRTNKVNKKIGVALTAYSSSFFECDGNPFRTASGTYVRDGIVATNFLPFGTKIRIPKIFGDKIFIVEDRMAKRYWYKVDIWMPSYKTAINFGKKYAEIEILN